jgi:hypothetical protein
MRGGKALLLAIALVTPQLAAADEVAVRDALHDGFARIAFDWPQPVTFETHAKDLTFTLHFARPLHAPVDRLPRELKDYVASAMLNADGTSLALQLAQPMTASTFTLHGTTVVLDLRPAPPKRAPKPHARAPAPAPKAPVAVHMASAAASNGATRVSFEWPHRVAYGFHVKGTRAELSVRATGAIDSAALAQMLPGFAPKVEAGPRATKIAFTLPPGASLKAMRAGAAIVLEASVPKPAAPPPQPQPAPAEAAPQPAQAAAAQPTQAAAPPAPAPQPDAAATTPPPPPPETVAVHLDTNGTVASLRFDWPAATAAAVFRRGPALWVVFATPTTLDFADAEAHGAAIFTALTQVPVEHATALRILTRTELEPSVRRAGTAWIVDLAPQATRSEAPIVFEAHPAAVRAKVTFRVHGGAAPVHLADAEIGPLIVVPVGELARGVDEESDLVDFRVLPSIEGIVLAPFASDLDITATDDGVDVTRPGGLILSSDRDRLLGRGAAGAATLFDFADWRGPRDADYVEERAHLDNAIAAAAPGARTAPRLALAHFYFGHLFAAETLAVLDAIGHDDPQRLDDPPVAALLGAACLLAKDLKCAADALGKRSLDGDPEAALWRASLASAQGDEETAAKGFVKSVSLLPVYPPALRARFALEAARAMLDTNRTGLSGPLLDLVLNDRATNSDRAMALYLDGRRLLQSGRLDDALHRWDQAVATGDQHASAEALAARANALLDAGRITRPEAIKALDAQRFAWRGGHFEFALLKKLGELQLAEGDDSAALDVLHEAAMYFPHEPEAKDVAKEASDDFAKLFLEAKANDVPPLRALALYDQFHDLEPLGDRHDAIVKKLIDRLVSVDLLDRAASLLEDQVTHRLVGLDKAQGATQLAVLRLMDHQPEMAMQALDIDVGRDLPQGLARQRQQLRARVLMELGKPDDALKLIANDDSRDADRLRADIYWHGHDWKSAAETLARLAGQPPADGKIDADEGRVVIGLAAALTLDDDQPGLAKLRAAFGPAMATSRYAAAFRVLAGDGASTQTAADPETMAVQVAQVGALQNFMAMYEKPTAVR